MPASKNIVSVSYNLKNKVQLKRSTNSILVLTARVTVLKDTVASQQLLEAIIAVFAFKKKFGAVTNRLLLLICPWKVGGYL